MIYEILKDDKRIALLIEDKGVIRFMFTEPEYRRQGYMTQLYEMVKKDCPDVIFDNNRTVEGKQFIKTIMED